MTLSAMLAVGVGAPDDDGYRHSDDEATDGEGVAHDKPPG
jgi:hypothetical protein